MPLFTKENAATLGRKGGIARWKRILPEPLLAPPKAEPPPEPEAETYTARRLARVRIQLDQVDQRIADESAKRSPDGQLLNWLVAAQERLSDQEFALANRPKPGQRRPGPEPVRRLPPAPALDSDPVVAPSSGPSPSAPPATPTTQ